MLHIQCPMMKEHSQKEIEKLTKNGYKQADDDELNELRRLLFGVDPTKLNKIYERLDNPQITAEDISRLLPEAVILRTMQDKNLSEAIVPTVEQAIHTSVRQDLNILSDAIFPIIGSASRKAIGTALDEMLQSLNQTLEHSLSPQSFKWRLEARQTGKSFAEVVLLRTLIYRVEQVFLIHKETGLLLQHVVGSQVAVQDPDLVSAMLTAIQDFIKDSFKVQQGDTLQSLEFGELTISIQEGPVAILACIIRGNAPQQLRLIFQQVLEKIHLKLDQELNSFTGETEQFTASKPYLEVCLESQYKLPKKKNYIYAWTFLGIITFAVGIWGFFAIKNEIRWKGFVNKLNSQPGIVVLQAGRQHGKYFISGMRDSSGVDPNMLMTQADLNPKTVITEWKPYLSLEPPFVLKRAKDLLQPPQTVSLKVDERGILYVSGSAKREWILELRKLWRFIPGVSQLQEKNLVDLELSKLEEYKKQIEKQMPFFVQGTTEFLPNQESKLQNLVITVQKLLDLAKNIDKDVRIQIVGHTDTTGTEQTNILLSQARANKILSYLSSAGINTKNFRALGVGSTVPLNGGNVQTKESLRRVSFEVLLDEGKTR
ncbi:OmpA family protein [Aetokthonos hydrillicola Thurmond2011]|uniref:OmpA family protein n=2 Tax=Aetokthonos TaxID=1550243 RepID=A0AAP5M9U9_9CYAN|nr:OmpA family protein [Aetokthonos hydrillicola Thurmond2011]